MRRWTIRVVQEYEGDFESADEALRTVQGLSEREAHGLTRVDGMGVCAPVDETEAETSS